MYYVSKCAFHFLNTVPSQPPSNVLNTSCSTTWIQLTWMIPSAGERNGIIIKYLIDLSSRDENITVAIQTPTFSSPENLYYNITGLSAGSEYTVRVAASTVNGTGPFTREVRISTLDKGECYNILPHNTFLTHNEYLVSSWTSQKFDF